jgi:surface protein
MFKTAYGLLTLQVDNFDTSGVTDMGEMFRDTWNLSGLDVSNFDTSVNTDFSYMFQNYDGATLDVTGLVTTEALYMRVMFSYSSLVTLDISSFDMSKLTGVDGMIQMFFNCNVLTTLTLPSVLARKPKSTVTSFQSLFDGCNDLTDLDCSDWDVSGVGSFYGCFQATHELNTLDISGWVTSSATAMNYMFNVCQHVLTLDVSGFDTSGVSNFHSMFRNTTYMGGTLDCSHFDMSNASDCRNMFETCGGSDTGFKPADLDLIDVSGWLFPGNTQVSRMFEKAGAITIDVTDWDTSAITYFGYMFNNAEELTTIVGLATWDTGAWNSGDYVFGGLNNLGDIEIDGWNIALLARFSGGCNATMSVAHYDAILIAWGGQSLTTFISSASFGSVNKYTAGGAAEAGRDALELGWGVTINDGGPA